MNKIINDNPTTDDLLNRAPFANSLTDLIINAPQDTSFRIGVYGDWGEGKTSVLRMMDKRLEDKNHYTSVLVPWGAKSTEELLERVIRLIVEALKISNRNFIKSTPVLISDAWKRISQLDWKLKLADAIIGKALSTGSDKVREWHTSTIFSEISQALSEKKLVIFIDDLDRADPKILPDLLLTLREILDLPGVYYVLALSPEIVKEGLRQVHSGWKDDPVKFLEKIIEYPNFLPKPSEEDIKRYINHHIQSIPTIYPYIIEDLSDLFPKNPRHIKSFIRFLSALSGQYERFGEDEMDFRTLYCCLMLRLEYPKEVTQMINDQDLMKDIEQGYTALLTGREDDIRQRFEEFSPQQEPSKSRFIKICEAIMSRSFWVSYYRLKDMLTLIDQPPLLTFKELREIFEKYAKSPPDKASKVLHEWLNEDPTIRANRATELFSKSLDLRNQSFQSVIDAQTEDEIKDEIVNLELKTRFLNAMIVDEDLISSGNISVESIVKLIMHLTNTSRFETPQDLYGDLRETEIQMLESLSKQLNLDYQEKIFIQTKMELRRLQASPSKRFKKKLDSILDRFEETIARSVLERFEQPDGLDSLWGREDRDAQKEIAFDSKSPFHNETFRQELLTLASKAPQNITIQKNFLNYLSQLIFAATEQSSSFDLQSSRSILRDYDFIKSIWMAAVTRRLNRRVMGSLKNDRQRLIAEFQFTEDCLPVPAWWVNMEKEELCEIEEN